MKRENVTNKSKTNKLFKYITALVSVTIMAALGALFIPGLAEKAFADGEDDEWSNVSMVEFCGQTVKEFSMELDISNYQIQEDVETFSKELDMFPILTKLVMCDCGYTNDDMDYLIEQHPDIKFVWKLHFENRWSCRTDAKAFSTLQDKGYTITLNNDDAAQFKYCTEMQMLDIGHNRVTDLTFLKNLPDLRILILHANYDRLNGGKLRDISYLKYCPKLTYLEIFKSDVTDLSVLQYLPYLRDLYASNTPISDITFLMNMPSIKKLYIEDTKISVEDYHRLMERYPEANIKYYGHETVHENGWRLGDDYRGMRYTLRNNELAPVYEGEFDLDNLLPATVSAGYVILK